MRQYKAEEIYQLLEKTGAFSVRSYDSERQIKYWSNASEELYGYSSSEMQGGKIEDIVAPEGIRDSIVEAQNDWVDDGTNIPFRLQTFCRSDGSFIDVYSCQIMLENGDRESEMVCIDIDLSKIFPDQARSNRNEQFLNSILQASPDLFFLMDQNCRILDYRAKKEDHLYAPKEEFLGESMQNVVPPSIGQLFVNGARTVNQTGDTAIFEYTMEVSSGNRQFSALISQQAGNSNLVAAIRDVTEQKRAEEAHKNSENMYRQMFEKNRAIKLIINPHDGSVHEANAAAVEFYGYTKDELCSLKISDINTLNELAVMHEMELAEKEERLFFNFRHRLKNGEIRDVEVYSGPVNYGGEVLLYSIINDVTAKKKAEKLIVHQAHYDSLTNLPNRFLSLDRLSQLLTEAKREHEKVAVLFLDLDDFKKINDSLGHEAGDSLLIEASQRLVDVLRSGDTIGRLGGDEFIVLLRGLKQGTDATHTVENLLEQFRKPFSIDNHDLMLTASMGIAIYPDDGEGSSTLLKHSDIAMYKAKELGRNTYSFYTESMNKAVSRRLSLEAQMHGALERNEFTVNYQPQIDVSSGKVIGAEALLRWSNAKLGQVSPVDFIPVAEQTGLIVPIGEFVIAKALETLSNIHRKGYADFRMAVNLSPRQFRDPKLVSFIVTSMENANIKTQFLELEITEGLLLTGHTFVDKALRELHEIGLTLSMDDFGTGYSSLSYLRQYPFDILKIDRSFIAGIAENSPDLELVIATVAMAQALGLKIVAEGVENESQLQVLSQLNCDFAQGYLFGKALPEADFFSFLESYEY